MAMLANAGLSSAGKADVGLEAGLALWSLSPVAQASAKAAAITNIPSRRICLFTAPSLAFSQIEEDNQTK